MPRTPTESLPPIYSIRGLRVVLDADLARLYGVETKRLNEALRRNCNRFPADFAFQLNGPEALELARSRSQIATLKRGQNVKFRPHVFTEYGALQVANILRSDHAIAMSIFLVRMFVRMREELATSAVILKRLAEIDRKLLEHDVVLRDIYQKLLPLLRPPPEPPKRRIGFQ